PLSSAATAAPRMLSPNGPVQASRSMVSRTSIALAVALRVGQARMRSRTPCPRSMGIVQERARRDVDGPRPDRVAFAVGAGRAFGAEDIGAVGGVDGDEAGAVLAEGLDIARALHLDGGEGARA